MSKLNQNATVVQDQPKVGRDTTIKSFKTDILTKIAEKYHKTTANQNDNRK